MAARCGLTCRSTGGATAWLPCRVAQVTSTLSAERFAPAKGRRISIRMVAWREKKRRTNPRGSSRLKARKSPAAKKVLHDPLRGKKKKKKRGGGYFIRRPVIHKNLRNCSGIRSTSCSSPAPSVITTPRRAGARTAPPPRPGRPRDRARLHGPGAMQPARFAARAPTRSGRGDPAPRRKPASFISRRCWNGGNCNANFEPPRKHGSKGGRPPPGRPFPAGYL